MKIQITLILNMFLLNEQFIDFENLVNFRIFYFYSLSMSESEGNDEDFIEEEEVILDDNSEDDDIVIASEDEYMPQIEETKPEVDEELEKLKKLYDPKNAAETRLLHDLRAIQKSDPKENHFTAQPINGSISNWEVRINEFDPKDEIAKDMQKYEKMTNKNYIKMIVSFPPDYPMSPPFVRVVEPRFQFHTGRVTVGGSLCTDVLTMESWNPMYDIQSLIINIVSVMLDAKPKIDFSNMTPYSLEEARVAYRRVAADHGWKVSNWLPK